MTQIASPLKEPKLVPGIPVLGSALEMAKDPARFFVDAYRAHGSVFKVKILGTTYTTLAGAEAANFMQSKEGRESLRSREFWEGLVNEWGATQIISGVDGETHAKLRTVLRHGYSKDAVQGRYGELVQIADDLIARDWQPGAKVAVLPALQHLVTEQLGAMLVGRSPREYVEDIRTTTLYMLNVLVTRQRPRFLLLDPRYRRAKARVEELGRRMISEYQSANRNPASRNLVDDIMEAHQKDPELIPGSDLIVSLTGPFVAGLDTVANTLGALVYAVLKHPAVLERIQREAAALFARETLDEEALRSIPSVHGAIMEAMRLYPIAVAQMRTATRDFEFEGHQIHEGELLFVATSVPHFMEEFFPEPDRFDIDRYTKPRAEHLTAGAYSPWGRGAHICLGKSLAEVQLALTAARLFHRLELALDPPGYVLETKTAPTPGPSMKFQVQVKAVRT